MLPHDVLSLVLGTSLPYSTFRELRQVCHLFRNVLDNTLLELLPEEKVSFPEERGLVTLIKLPYLSRLKYVAETYILGIMVLRQLPSLEVATLRISPEGIYPFLRDFKRFFKLRFLYERGYIQVEPTCLRVDDVYEDLSVLYAQLSTLYDIEEYHGSINRSLVGLRHFKNLARVHLHFDYIRIWGSDEGVEYYIKLLLRNLHLESLQYLNFWYSPEENITYRGAQDLAYREWIFKIYQEAREKKRPIKFPLVTTTPNLPQEFVTLHPKDDLFPNRQEGRILISTLPKDLENISIPTRNLILQTLATLKSLVLVRDTSVTIPTPSWFPKELPVRFASIED
jgi:hypothetical protein